MKAMIAGAGQVGVALAKYLRTENHDVVLIGSDKSTLGHLAEQLDIQTVVGSASSPAVLERAGADDVDVFLAVTGSDETNILSCCLAKSMFHVSKRIARLNAVEYLVPKYADFLKELSVDVVISPEIETATRVMAEVSIAGAVDVASLANDQVQFIGLKCRKNCALVGKTVIEIRKLIGDVNFSILAVRRKNQLINLTDTPIRAGDEVYILVASGHLERVLDIFGYTYTPPKSVLIFGGGHVGFQLARMLEKADVHNITLIEKSEAQAKFLAEHLKETLVLYGDGFDDVLLDDINFSSYQMAIATTQSDEDNILLSLLAKRNGMERTCALIHNDLYKNYMQGLGVDSLIDPDSVMDSAILQHLRKGRVQGGYFLQSGLGEVLEVSVLKTAKITRGPLGKIKIPEGIVLGGVIRNGIFIRPNQDLIVQEGDTVFVFVATGRVADAEKLFTVELSFF